MASPQKYSRAGVEREAARMFGSASVKGIMALLDQYEADKADGRARVQAACLKLSEGNIEKLKHFVQQAKLDFRDVLYWAES